MTLVEEIKEFAKVNNYPTFTIPDNCVGDGWDGRLTENGAYCFGYNHFNFFKYEEMDNDLIETILGEAEIDE